MKNRSWAVITGASVAALVTACSGIDTDVAAGPGPAAENESESPYLFPDLNTSEPTLETSDVGRNNGVFAGTSGVTHSQGALVDDADPERTSSTTSPEVEDTTTGAEAVAPVQSNKEALAEDLALIAAAHGWSLEQSAAQYERQLLLQRIEPKLQAQRPDVYAGSALSDIPGDAPFMFLKEGAEDALILELEASGIQVSSGMTFSEREMSARRDRVHETLVKAGFTAVGSWFDPRDGEAIRVVVSRQTGLPESEEDALSLLPSDVRGNVLLSMREQPVARPEYAYGGLQVFGLTVCTSGWSTINEIGTTGIVTAAHCIPVDNLYHTGGGVHPTTLAGSHWGTWGDFAIYTTTTNEPAQFQNNLGNIRNVTGVATSYPLGTGLCFYSPNSERECGAVVAANDAMCTYDGVTMNHMVMMNAHVTENGDSGGPWYVGTTAYGIHGGYCPNSAFSKPQFLATTVGWVVRTQ